MADNVSVTPGAGAPIATDDIGGVHHQRVKLEFGADGTAIDVSPTNPLPVTQLSATPAGEAHIGAVGGHTFKVPLDLTLLTTPYPAGSLLAETQSITVMRVPGGSAMITDVGVADKADQKVPMTIYFLQASQTFGAEGAESTLTDSASHSVIGHISIAAADYATPRVGGVSIAHVEKLVSCKAIAGSQDIYVAVVLGASGATYGAAGIRLWIGGVAD